MVKTQEALKLALEALERCVATCFEQYAHEQVMSRPEHFVNQTITAIREALAEQPAQQWTDETAKVPDHVWVTPKLRPLAKIAREQQEPVARSSAYDMIDRFLRNNLNSDEDYAEYSKALDSLYTSPPANANAGKPWVRLTDEDTRKINQEVWGYVSADHTRMWNYARAIEAKLREKNA